MTYIPFSVQTSLSSTAEIYLKQWLKVASGDRVYLSQHTKGMYYSYTVFKCVACGDNWHVGDENFKGTQIPSVLKDWVHKHRHVCSKYKADSPDLKMPCLTCKWPYGAHEESWLTPPKPTDDKGNIPGMKWVLSPVIKLEAEAGETLPEFTGRVFRD